MITLNPRLEEQEAMEIALAGKQARILAEKKEKKKAKASKKELEAMNGADPSMLSTTSSSKRKLDESTTPGGANLRDQPSKKQHLSTLTKAPTATTAKPSLSSTHSLTAAVAAKVAEQMAVNASVRKSSAIQSLYSNGRASKENFMNR